VSVIDKIIYGAFTLFVAGALIYYVLLCGRMKAQAAEIVRLETRLLECAGQVRDAEAAIARQNAAAEAARVDTVLVVKQIEGIKQDYSWTHKIVEEKINKDSSCENKLVIIDGLLRGYHGVRAKDNDKD
jgi:hypothetical protein